MGTGGRIVHLPAFSGGFYLFVTADNSLQVSGCWSALKEYEDGQITWLELLSRLQRNLLKTWFCHMKRKTFSLNRSHFLFITGRIQVFPPRHLFPDFSSELEPLHHHKPALTRDKEITSTLFNLHLEHIYYKNLFQNTSELPNAWERALTYSLSHCFGG